MPHFNLLTSFHSDGAETMYYFTALALTLNEPEEGVAPTDSRLRPDQRLMEDGRWDEANSEKQRLEEKQRSVRREREREAASQRTSSQTEEGESKANILFFCGPLLLSRNQSDWRGLRRSLWPTFYLSKAVDEDSLTDPTLKSKYIFFLSYAAYLLIISSPVFFRVFSPARNSQWQFNSDSNHHCAIFAILFTPINFLLWFAVNFTNVPCVKGQAIHHLSDFLVCGCENAERRDTNFSHLLMGVNSYSYRTTQIL